MINKKQLRRNVDKAKGDTKAALQTVYGALNQGQQKKLLKDEAVKALFERYGVEV